MRGRGAAVSGFLLAGVLAAAPAAPVVPPARAEHAVEYRYTVLGYVTDAAGRPRQGVRVELVREKTGFSYLGETDATGFYVIIARLGDESAGEPLSLRADGQTVALRARMNPADHETERG
ncbi:MAG TPA: carboxypeptidase-like regulatory domain-containing protein, partial [Candidatus Dormibacteraeota bacterium]|nr:carboxypeptidase-like regulatory domain-containing protein [Candidatus Dormibacteraeota bacterium]